VPCSFSVPPPLDPKGLLFSGRTQRLLVDLLGGRN